MSHHSGGPPSDQWPHPRHTAGANASDSVSNSPPSSGAATPTSASAGSASFLSGSFYNAFGGLIRRLSSDPAGHLQPTGPSSHHDYNGPGTRSLNHSSTSPSPFMTHHAHAHAHSHAHSHLHQNDGVNTVFTPQHAHRTASPVRPPPLEPLTLKGFHADTPASARLLTSSIAEEIRIMVPERLRIEDEWKLVYSLDQDGASLATLYEKCAAFAEHRNGFVLLVQDQEGGIFGAYLSEHPHPSPHYFGTGECFLWRASLLAALTPPPSADTTHLPTRNPAISGTSPKHGAREPPLVPEPLIPGLEEPPAIQQTAASSAASFASADHSTSSLASMSSAASSVSSAVAPIPPRPPSSPSIRFSAFPYSGINEYFLYCEAHSLSVGGGDGKYGLWLDDSLEKGVSAMCLTFGNQPLSDEGEKFGVLGVEVWVIGSRR